MLMEDLSIFALQLDDFDSRVSAFGKAVYYGKNTNVRFIQQLAHSTLPAVQGQNLGTVLLEGWRLG